MEVRKALRPVSDMGLGLFFAFGALLRMGFFITVSAVNCPVQL